MPSSTSRTLFGVQINTNNNKKNHKRLQPPTSFPGKKKSVSFNIIPTKITIVENRSSSSTFSNGKSSSSSSIPIALLSTSNLVSLLNYYHRQKQLRKQQQQQESKRNIISTNRYFASYSFSSTSQELLESLMFELEPWRDGSSLKIESTSVVPLVPKFAALRTAHEVCNNPTSMAAFFGGSTHRNNNFDENDAEGSSSNDDDDIDNDDDDDERDDNDSNDFDGDENEDILVTIYDNSSHDPGTRRNLGDDDHDLTDDENDNRSDIYFTSAGSSTKKERTRHNSDGEAEENKNSLASPTSASEIANASKRSRSAASGSNNQLKAPVTNETKSLVTTLYWSDEFEALLEALFRFICLHSQDDTLASSRRVIANGTLAAAVNLGARLSAIRSAGNSGVSSLNSWFLRQACLGSLAAPDLAGGLVRAARRCSQLPFGYHHKNNRRQDDDDAYSADDTHSSISGGGDISRRKQRDQNDILSLYHESVHVEELASWTFLLLHHAIFHSKSSSSSSSNNNNNHENNENSSTPRSDFLEAAFAFASVLCPQARANMEPTTYLHFSNHGRAAVLPVLAQRIVAAGLVLSLAWAKIRGEMPGAGGAPSEPDLFAYYKDHFHPGLEASVEYTYQRLRAMNAASPAAWFASTLTTWAPSVARWANLMEYAPDCGIEGFLYLNSSYESLNYARRCQQHFTNRRRAQLQHHSHQLDEQKSNRHLNHLIHFRNWLPWSLRFITTTTATTENGNNTKPHDNVEEKLEDELRFFVIDRVHCWC